MKKTLQIALLLMSLFTLTAYSQITSNENETKKPTTIGIVIYSNDVETIWNALRFANFSKKQGDKVSIFLLGKGVELDSLIKTEKDLKGQTDKFLDNGGTILGCGTCLQSRNFDSPKVCTVSSMNDLYDLVRQNKIVMTF